MNIKGTLKDFDKGFNDCVNFRKAKIGESAKYYEGYAQAYELGEKQSER